MLQNAWFLTFFLLMEHKNKNTQCKGVSISCYCAIKPDAFFPFINVHRGGIIIAFCTVMRGN